MPRATVTRLPTERLRRLERRLQAMDTRLDALTRHADALEDVLKRLVRVVALQHRRVVREHERSEARLSRLIADVARGRTAELRRLTTLERRGR
jgi:hypothetical protein